MIKSLRLEVNRKKMKKTICNVVFLQVFISPLYPGIFRLFVENDEWFDLDCHFHLLQTVMSTFSLWVWRRRFLKVAKRISLCRLEKLSFFISTNLNLLYQRMRCKMCGRNWPSGPTEVEKLKNLQTNEIDE